MIAEQPTTGQRIADVALEILEQEGASAVSMRRVASVVGITPMAIYHHFTSRGNLLQVVTDREFGKLLHFIEARRKRTPAAASCSRVLIELMEGYIDYALAHPRIFDYVFSQPRPNARQFPDDFRARRSPTLNPVADCVAEGMRLGHFRKDDMWETALSLWAHVHGYVVLFFAGRFRLTDIQFRALCRRSLERMIDGIKAR